MTNEEMERAIDFLLKSQTNFEARLEQSKAEWAERETQRQAEQAQRDARLDGRFELTNQQIAETEKKIGAFADLLAEFIQVVTTTFDAQVRINESQKEFRQSVREAGEFQRSFNQSVREAHQAQREFEQGVREAIESQNALNESVSAALTRLTESQAQTDRRLNVLIDIVRGGRDRE